jgi:hypothetical protein
VRFDGLSCALVASKATRKTPSFGEKVSFDRLANNTPEMRFQIDKLEYRTRGATMR